MIDNWSRVFYDDPSCKLESWKTDLDMLLSMCPQFLPRYHLCLSANLNCNEYEVFLSYFRKMARLLEQWDMVDFINQLLWHHERKIPSKLPRKAKNLVKNLVLHTAPVWLRCNWRVSARKPKWFLGKRYQICFPLSFKVKHCVTRTCLKFAINEQCHHQMYFCQLFALVAIKRTALVVTFNVKRHDNQAKPNDFRSYFISSCFDIEAQTVL